YGGAEGLLGVFCAPDADEPGPADEDPWCDLQGEVEGPDTEEVKAHRHGEVEADADRKAHEGARVVDAAHGADVEPVGRRAVSADRKPAPADVGGGDERPLFECPAAQDRE